MRIFAALAALSLPAAAQELELRDFYALNQPASLEYDPTFCGLWIANEGREVVLVTLAGEELRRWSSDLYRVKALTVMGEDVIVADGLGRYQRLSKSGEPRGAPYRIGVGMDTEGMVGLPGGGMVLVEDDPARLVWIDPAGEVVSQIAGESFDPPLVEPQGIARDPRTGHLLVVDDWEGTNALWVLEADGGLVGRVPLIAYGRDPEGVALRPGDDALFVGFDQGARIAAFTYTPPTTGTLDDPGADCMMF
ncbi:hypothetical protein [Pseudaestuariivita atlantica]|uniref:BPP domain-containing protein n=1 Tax=Pseudaestuariivita atlantica TaxID=1317121 RepID=A0A0L1JRF5_9RHOB|nr:hypothetical protein [Pseudaestuariivita atlantica]KNG94321.1 hypothetical protein ATO11_08965 [Pseudaestuariivita atlantica]